MSPTLRRVWSTIAGQRLRYGAAIAALVVASCFLYLAPLIPQAVLDGVLAPAGQASAASRAVIQTLGGAEYLRGHLWVPALAFVLVSLVAGVFTYLRTRLAADASESIVRRVRDQVYDHLQHLPCRTLGEHETGDLIQRCTSDVETLRTFLGSQVVEIGRALVMLLVPIPLMLAIDWRMTAASLLLIPVICLYSFVSFRRIKSAFLAVDEAEGLMTARIQENLTGIRVVRAFARQAHEQERFGERNQTRRELDYRLYCLLARFWSTSDLLCFTQKGLVLAAGSYWIAQGTLAVGAFFYFLTAVSLFIWPVRHMGRILADLGKAVVALERLDEILTEARERDPEEPAPLAAQLAAPLAGDLVFEDVSFAHGELPVLQGVSFQVRAGETLGILGASGSGKSTVIDLLLRLYDYDAGSIRLGGRELRELPRKEARRHVAVALQEPFLYSKTLAQNLRLCRADASAEDLREATADAHVHETIERFAAGYETLVGERGVTLSGGQRQRVSLARALLQRPAVLVLDDALSAVDAATEGAILRRLRALRAAQGEDAPRTTVVIAHRVSTVMDADQILVLHEGRVVQRGTHETLLAEEGPYRRLWRAQTSLDTDEGAADAAPDEERARPRRARSSRLSTPHTTTPHTTDKATA